MARHVEGVLADGAPKDLAVAKQRWDSSLRPASAGQQSMYVVCSMDATGIMVSQRSLFGHVRIPGLDADILPACTGQPPTSVHAWPCHLSAPFASLPQMNEPMFLSIEGELQLEALEFAVNQLIRRHEVLQCAFRLVDGKVMMEVQADAAVRLNLLQVGTR